MALQPKDLSVQERMQPGAYGEKFKVDMPGYRNSVARVNRTNNKLDTGDHDVLNQKYEMDYRLKPLFTYGFGYGFNQFVIPKGRIVAVDPHMDLPDSESHKIFNTLTMANGGVPVRLRKHGDKYPEFGKGATDIVSDEMQGQPLQNIGCEWTPVVGMDKAYDKHCYRPFYAAGKDGEAGSFVSATVQMADAKLTIDAESGRLALDGDLTDEYRPGNVPIGMIDRNEYTRDNDAYNGMMPGAVLTDALVELPFFAFKDKAEENYWGSIYGNLKPGDLLKSDENGRLTLSPLSVPEDLATMSIAEYETERQQVVGQVYSINHELVPEGAAKYATWALEDRMNSEVFNPDIYAKTNRRGEDAVNGSPFNSEGKYPGYPYEKNYLNHDLHMLVSAGRKDVYDPRMNPEFQYSNLGIPGLTGGENVAKRDIPMVKAQHVSKAPEGQDYVRKYIRALEVQLVEDSMKIQFGDEAPQQLKLHQKYHGYTCTYLSEKQGVAVLEVLDKVADRKELEDFLADKADGVDILVGGTKRGMAGVPTFMDWDGCIGSVTVLMQK